MDKHSKIFSQNITLVAIVLISAIFWNFESPQGISSDAWHLFIIFLATISGIILNPLPMGAVSMISIAACVLTHTLTLNECLSGFSNKTVWLVIFAFFISHGFIKTGLGSRVAYMLIAKLGRSTLGLSYSLVFANLFLSPGIPSVTARGGGIIFPVADALVKSYSDSDHPGVSTRNGGFIMQVCAQSCVLTSAMFLTAMAANPVAVDLANKFAGVEITWGLWALAASVPGLFCLLVMPLIVFYLFPPSIKFSETAPKLAEDHLAKIGPMSIKENIMLGIFLLLISLWVMGDSVLGISATTTALLGFCLLIVTRVIDFEDTISDKGAWHTFIWFSTLLMLSGFLKTMGVMDWVAIQMKSMIYGFSPSTTVVLIMLVFFYMHYLFASATAHISVLMPSFLLILIGYGISPMTSVLMLIFASILSSGLTHFGLASSPVFFNSGHIKTKDWWRIGFILSLFYILVWTILGGAWWKTLSWLGIW